jgi:hypothetical protein
MKLGNLPTYEEYIYRYRNFKNIGKNKYYEFCKKACIIIKTYLKKVDKYCNDNDLLMDIVYQVYDQHHISTKEY